MTIVSEVITRLEKSRIESARANAETMLTSILACRIVDIYMDDIVINTDQLKQLEDMVNRRITGEPLQYITGKVDFYGNELSVEPCVFIPRPETEILVEAVLKQIAICDIRHTTYEPLIFDLCTGSGNIAISLAKALTGCKIVASDISDRAMGLARRNAVNCGVSERIDFIKADLFKIPKIYKERFDVIVSNPPYVASATMKDLPVDVKNEPQKALDGGRDGMDFYMRIMKESPVFLKDKGLLALELCDDTATKVREILESSGDFSDIQIFKDLNCIERVAVARKA